jgi:phosphoglycerate dehydrogenase-like enzyme
VTVLLPYAAAELPGAPTTFEYVQWDGAAAPPGDLARVDFYVPPYFSGDRGIAPIREMSNLRVIQTQTAGVDDLLPALPADVTMCNARGVHDTSTAELAVGLMIAAQRGIPDFVRAQHERAWAGGVRPSLADSTVLIVGYGSIGAAVERRLGGFEVDVIRVAARARPDVHGTDELPTLLPRADIVVVLVPLTDATRGLVGADFLGRLRDGALLVNVSRGPVVDTDALLAELNNGRLRAALDVTDPEPLPADHPLWAAPNVIITPHVGGASTAMRPRIRQLLADQLSRFATEQPLANVVVAGSRYDPARPAK